MSLSPHSRNNTDFADRASSAIGAITLLAMLAVFVNTSSFGPRIGEARVFPETTLQIALMPAAPAPDLEPEPEPDQIPELAPTPVEPPPEPEEDPVPEVQSVVEREGEAGIEDAIRVEWMARLRRRIEENKFYPGAARYARESGTVMLSIEIGTDARIGRVEVVENSGSALLAEGAQAILRRVAAAPLDTNRLSSPIRVEVPITYRMRPR